MVFNLSQCQLKIKCCTDIDIKCISILYAVFKYIFNRKIDWQLMSLTVWNNFEIWVGTWILKGKVL